MKTALRQTFLPWLMLGGGLLLCPSCSEDSVPTEPDPIVKEARTLTLSGGPIDATLSDFTFRQVAGGPLVEIKRTNGVDSLLILIPAGGSLTAGVVIELRAASILQVIYTDRTNTGLGFSNLEGTVMTGSLTFTTVALADSITAVFSEGARLSGSDFSNPSQPQFFEVALSGGFRALPAGNESPHQ